MKKKRIIVGSGEKGGVGKTLALTAAIEHAIGRGMRVYLLEGDPSIPDVQFRYQSTLAGIQASLSRPDSAGEAMVEVMNAIERVWDEVDLIAINTPAGAAATVDTMARELIAPTLEVLGGELVTLYVMGPGEESVTCLHESLTRGLCSVSAQCVAIANEFFGDPARFAWAASELRRQWLVAGHVEAVLPRMIARVAQRVRAIPAPLGAIVQGEVGGLSIVERAGLSSWLRSCAPLAALALGDEEDAQ